MAIEFYIKFYFMVVITLLSEESVFAVFVIASMCVCNCTSGND